MSGTQRVLCVLISDRVCDCRMLTLLIRVAAGRKCLHKSESAAGIVRFLHTHYHTHGCENRSVKGSQKKEAARAKKGAAAAAAAAAEAEGGSDSSGDDDDSDEEMEAYEKGPRKAAKVRVLMCVLSVFELCACTFHTCAFQGGRVRNRMGLKIKYSSLPLSPFHLRRRTTSPNPKACLSRHPRASWCMQKRRMASAGVGLGQRHSL